MKTFRVTRKMQILYMAAFLVTLAALVLMAYLPFRLFTVFSSVFGQTHSSYPLVLLIGALPFLIFSIWAGTYAVAVRRARLIFEDKTLVFESINHLKFILQNGLKPLALPYDQIKNVKIGSLVARVEIIDIKGKKNIIFPALFGKNYGEDVLIELGSHLPREAFASGMEISDVLRQWSKQNKTINVFAISLAILYLATLFFDPKFPSRSWLTDAWQVERHPLGYESVSTYSIDTQNNFWVVSWKSTYYRVYNFSDKIEDEWELPKDLLGGHYPQFVSGGKAGEPIVWLENQTLHYENEGWKAIPYHDNLDLENWDSQGIVLGEYGWVIEKQEQNKRLLKIDALTGKWSVIELSETAMQQKLSLQSMRRATNGDFLVLMQGDASSRVYLLSDDKWKSHEYPVILSENSRVRDYFLDDNNSLWVLFEVQNKFIVEKIDSTGELRLTQLPSPKETDEWERYKYLIVDSSERLWVSGGYPDFMAVFTPVWRENAREILRYTEGNSNYQGDISVYPVMLPNGQIWSFDRMITTMDTSLTPPPSPLPAWFVSWDWNLIRLFFITVQLLFMIVFYLLSLRRVYLKKQKIIPQE